MRLCVLAALLGGTRAQQNYARSSSGSSSWAGVADEPDDCLDMSNLNVSADECLGMARISAACPLEMLWCYNSTGQVGGCAERLPKLLALRNRGVKVSWWQEHSNTQAAYVCGMQNITELFCAKTEDVGSLSREVLQLYCHHEIAAGQHRCMATEHNDCCSCHSQFFPTIPDNGHCCADCTKMCEGRPTRLDPGDRCAGIAIGECNPVDLLVRQ